MTTRREFLANVAALPAVAVALPAISLALPTAPPPTAGVAIGLTGEVTVHDGNGAAASFCGKAVSLSMPTDLPSPLESSCGDDFECWDDRTVVLRRETDPDDVIYAPRGSLIHVTGGKTVLRLGRPKPTLASRLTAVSDDIRSWKLTADDPDMIQQFADYVGLPVFGICAVKFYNALAENAATVAGQPRWLGNGSMYVHVVRCSVRREDVLVGCDVSPQRAMLDALYTKLVNNCAARVVWPFKSTRRDCVSAPTWHFTDGRPDDVTMVEAYYAPGFCELAAAIFPDDQVTEPRA